MRNGDNCHALCHAAVTYQGARLEWCSLLTLITSLEPLDMDGPPPQEEDFSSLSISERLNHKNWKARVSGYESLIKTFQTTASDSDPAFKPYVSNTDLLKKIVTDPNAVAQEKGVECIVTLIKFAGETASKTRDTVVPALVDKCLGSTRAGTKNQAIELILQYVEVENSAAGVVVRAAFELCCYSS